MSVRKKLLALIAVLSLGLAPLFTTATAHATPPDPIETQKQLTADYLAGLFVADPDGAPGKCIVSEWTGKCGPADDAALSLAQMGLHKDVVDDYVTYMESYVKTSASDLGSGAAGRLAILVTAAGKDAKNFGGVNLLTIAQEKYEGNYGAYSGGLSVIGIIQAGGRVSDNHIKWMLKQQKDDGSFHGPDSTAIAVLALKSYKDTGGTVDVSAELAKATKWIEDNAITESDGTVHWTADNPVNSQAYMVQVYAALGKDTKPLLNYLVAQDSNQDGEFDKCTPSTSCGSTSWATAQAGAALGSKRLDNLTPISAMAHAPKILLFKDGTSIADVTVKPGEKAVFTAKHDIDPSVIVRTNWYGRLSPSDDWSELTTLGVTHKVLDTADGSVLEITATDALNGLQIFAIGSNDYWNVAKESTIATIHIAGAVTPPANGLKFTKHPQSTQIIPGYAYTFSYDHAGEPEPLWAIWQTNTGDGWSMIDPATLNFAVGNKTLTVIPNGGQYNMQLRVILVKPDKTVLASDVATFMSPTYKFIKMPESALVWANSLASFSIDYMGAPGDLVWEYSMDGSSWSALDPATINYGSRGMTLDIIPTKALNGAHIRAVVHGINGEVITSDVARLYVV